MVTVSPILEPASHGPLARPASLTARRPIRSLGLDGDDGGGGRGSATETEELRRAWAAAAAVPDPEVPCVTVADLGILRAVDIVDGVAIAKVTPTYSGCPAVLAIELAVEAALREAGFEARVERVLSPPWTTDWITAEGREKLRAYGIAPPTDPASSIRSLFGEVSVDCPKCGSAETSRVSEFGSTACKALYRCDTCREPFDYFKCI
jgi:ring-1,2-phenylacetyl-CoA epoxidase subunit PaaD